MKNDRVLGKCDRLGHKVFFAFLVALTGFASMAEGWEIPTDRTITWQGNVGVEGGIPSRTTICSTLNPGATNSQINSALSSCPSGQVVYLNAGIYTITGSITIPSNKTLRGAGPGVTIIETSSKINGTTGIIRFGNGYTDRGSATKANIVSGYTQGSTQVTLDNASAFSAGNFVYVDELNDSPLVGGGETYLGMFGSGGSRNFAVIHKVTAVNGNVLTIDPPAVFSFKTNLSPQAIKATPSYAQFAGVEEMTIKNILVGSSPIYSNQDGNIAVMFQGAANCWAKNIKVENCGKRCMEIWLDGFRNTITGNWMQGCLNRVDSDRCYGTHTMMGSFNLIENNIYDSTGEGSMTSTAVGNVYAYNYSYDVHRTNDLSWDYMSDWTHGSHSAFNLFESNVSVGIKWDYIHGSGSHNTAFRNRLYSKQQLINSTNAVGAVITEHGNTYENMVGNVLGVSGWNNVYELKQPSGNTYGSSKPIWATGVPSNGSDDGSCFSTTLRHRNYDYYTNSVKNCNDAGEPGCQGGNSDFTLPASLYLPSKPSWWGNGIWPAIGPDVAGYFTNIPAMDRFRNAPSSTRPSPPKVWFP